VRKQNLRTLGGPRGRRARPVHTRVSYALSWLAAAVMIWIAARHWNDADQFSAALARYAALLAAFAALGNFAVDLLDGRGLEFPPRFRELDLVGERGLLSGTLARALLMLVVVMVVEALLVVSLRRFAVSDTELALYYIFAAVAEEVLFRGVIVTAVIRFTGRAWAAVGLSAAAFSLAHLSVYGSNPAMLLSTLVGGAVLAAGYAFVLEDGRLVYDPDLTAPILAHLLKNLIAVRNIIVLI